MYVFVNREFETLGDFNEYTDSSVADSKFTSISRWDSSLTNVSEQSSTEMLTEGPNVIRSNTDRRAASSPAGIESSTNRSVEQSQSDLLTESGVETSPSHTDRRIASSPAKENTDWSFRHPEMPGLIQPVPFKPSTTTTTTDISIGAPEELSAPLSPTYSSPRDSDQGGSRFKSKFSRYRLASHIHGESDTGSIADSITTMESTHTGSDDAIGPDLPRSMMGSRTDKSLQGGIYSKPASSVIPEQALSTIEERSTLDDKVSGESNRSEQSMGKIPVQDTTDSGLYTMTLRSQAHDTQQKTTMADSNQFVETNNGQNTTHQMQQSGLMGSNSIDTSNQGQQDNGRRSPFDEKYRALPLNVHQGQRSRSPSFDGRMEMSGRLDSQNPVMSLEQNRLISSDYQYPVPRTSAASLIDSQNPVMSLEQNQLISSDYQYPVPRTSAASLIDSQNPVMSLEQNRLMTSNYQYPVPRTSTASLMDSQNPVMSFEQRQPMTSDYQYPVPRHQDRILSPVARDTTRQSHTPVVVDMRLDERNGRQHQQVPSDAMDTHQNYYEEVSMPYDNPRSPVPIDTRQQYIEEQNRKNQRRSPVAMDTRQEIVSPRTDRQRYIEETYSRDNALQHLREDNPVQPRITQTEKIGHTGSQSNTGPTDEVIMKSRKTERRKQSERNRPQYGHDSTSEEEYLRGLEKSPRGARDVHLRQSLEAEISMTPPQDLSTMWPKYSEIYPSEAESQINPTQTEVFSELVNHPTRQLIYKYFNEREKSRQMIENRIAKERESRHQQSVRSDKFKDSDEPIPSSSFEQMNASYGEILEALAAERAKRLRRETKAKSMSRSAQKSGKSEKQKRPEAVPVQMMDSQDTLYSIPEDQSYDTLAATSNSQSQDSRDMESAITDPMSTLKHKIRLQREKIEKERRRELKRMEKLWKLEQLLKAKNSGLIGNFVLENNLNAISSTSTAASISESQDALSLDSTLTLSSHTELSDDISTTIKDSSYEVHKAKMNRSRQHAKDKYEAALHQLLSSGSSETLTEGEDTPNWAKKEEKRKKVDKPKETLRVGSKEVRKPSRGSEGLRDHQARKQARATEREKTTKSKEKGRKLIETRTKSQQSSPYKVKDRKLKSPKKPESFEISPVKWNHESTRVTSPSKTSKSAALLKGLSRNISPVKKSSSKSTYTSREPMTFHHDDTYYRTRSVSPERRWRNRGVQTSPKLRSRSCSPSFNDTQFISPSGGKKKKSKHGNKVVYLSHLYSPDFQENRSPKHRRKHREHREKPKPVPPPIAWYVSVDNTMKRPEPLQERVPDSQTAPPVRPRAVWTIDDDHLNSPEMKEETPEVTPRDIRSSEIIIDGELFKKPYAITLQEALIKHKKDFISKSRERQKRIALATEHRQMQDYLQMERDRIFGDRKRKGKKIEYPEYKDTVYGQPRKKLFTKKEMKEITARWYRNLPEVKYRERMEKRRQQNQINRLKAMVFNRKVQNTVLRRAGVIV
ncbi:hypothetical protein LOTGIDRAFT_231754 [Lottia gigantea]|uniref:ALMS motif domain-containing protein n=1 Tax=Lottia gigantea TaxID=225164 RepID=V4C5W3_LOTGI|nr:hypothetical protein LOTGIDRAFT_231754 [Lottia gigantea]ESO97004.1 hypothetical protein LOTGIDRAFT_231754 [Lottia gigantea]